MAQMGAPLTYAPSATTTNPTVSRSLPPEVVTCLKNARFLHLATSYEDMPHISLMNYTYLPATPFVSSPIIVMTTNPASKKTHNLVANPRVALLVHDWVSHRPPTVARDPMRDGSPPPQATRSSLATLLLNMNTQAMSRISATINGEARVVESGSDEEKWLKETHLDNNTFGDSADDYVAATLATTPGESVGDGGREHFIENNDVRVVVVKIRDGRIADYDGGVKDWELSTTDSDLANGI